MPAALFQELDDDDDVLEDRADWPPARITAARTGKDLHETAALAAALAAYAGDAGDWDRWLRLLDAGGVSHDDAIDSLTAQELRYLGRWSIRTSRERPLGLTAYARYLRSSPKIGPFDTESAEYLWTLLDAGARDLASQEASFILAATPRSPLVAVVSHALLVDGAAAARKLDRIALDIDRAPNERVLAASLSFARDQERRWAEVIADVLATRSVWKVLRARCVVIPRDLGIAVPDEPVTEPAAKGQTAGAPAYVVVTGNDERATFGEAGWSTSPCHGCGHPIHVWLSLAVPSIPELATWLPWQRAPLASCADCGFWMGVHRYRYDDAARRLALDETELDGDVKLAQAVQPPRTLAKQSAMLKKITAAVWRRTSERSEPSVVAGKPPRLEDHTWPRCRGCRAWMRYYGALGQSEGFEGQPILLNEHGFLMHFACVPCGRVTVVPNWS